MQVVLYLVGVKKIVCEAQSLEAKGWLRLARSHPPSVFYRWGVSGIIVVVSLCKCVCGGLDTGTCKGHPDGNYA